MEKREKDALLKLLEQEKRSVKGLTEQLKDAKVLVEEHECNVQQLADELMNRESRVRNLEADHYFMSAELQDLREKAAKLSQSEKETRERWKKECLKKRVHKWRTKMKMLRAFEWEKNTADPVLLRTVCTFWEALYDGASDDEERLTNDVDESPTKVKRMSQVEVRKMWKEVTLNGWAGQMKKELFKEFIKSKKYCPIQMARSSDVNSTFNVRAASDISKCDLTWQKYERGLLPSDQTCRRVMQCVYNAAVQIGFSSFPAEENGNVWCWGDADGRFTNGVNMYVYETYCKIDPHCEMATEHDPWLVPVTGDGTRV